MALRRSGDFVAMGRWPISIYLIFEHPTHSLKLPRSAAAVFGETFLQPGVVDSQISE